MAECKRWHLIFICPKKQEKLLFQRFFIDFSADLMLGRKKQMSSEETEMIQVYVRFKVYVKEENLTNLAKELKIQLFTVELLNDADPIDVILTDIQNDIKNAFRYHTIYDL